MMFKKKQLWLCDVIKKLRLGNFSCIRLLIIVDFYIFVLQAKIKVYLQAFLSFKMKFFEIYT